MREVLWPDDDEILRDAQDQARKARLTVRWWAEWYGVPQEPMQERLRALAKARRLALRKWRGCEVYGPTQTITQVVEKVKRSLEQRAGDGGRVSVSCKSIGLEVGESAHDVWVAIRRLEASGWLRRVMVGRGRSVSVYRVLGAGDGG